MEDSTAMLIGEIAFYAALMVLVVILVIKKRKQIKDSTDIDYKNQPKNQKDENN